VERNQWAGQRQYLVSGTSGEGVCGSGFVIGTRLLKLSTP